MRMRMRETWNLKFVRDTRHRHTRRMGSENYSRRKLQLTRRARRSPRTVSTQIDVIETTNQHSQTRSRAPKQIPCMARHVTLSLPTFILSYVSGSLTMHSAPRRVQVLHLRSPHSTRTNKVSHSQAADLPRRAASRRSPSLIDPTHGGGHLLVLVVSSCYLPQERRANHREGHPK